MIQWILIDVGQVLQLMNLIEKKNEDSFRNKVRRKLRKKNSENLMNERSDRYEMMITDMKCRTKELKVFFT